MACCSINFNSLPALSFHSSLSTSTGASPHLSPLFPSLSHHSPSSSSSLPSTKLSISSPLRKPPSHQFLSRAAEYVFPDPIPEFAEAETKKFSDHLLDKLTRKKKDLFGDSIEEVVRVCSEILSSFLHNEYGGPGTLLVIPFIDMADTLNERGLPGGPQAARAAVVWAQKHVDKDWNQWTKGGGSSDSE